ncbi:pseudouridine-5'-phosphate glycosidase [uncultured Photobacterium sp.]|uniref:pseudouridine-5'-phosphate glycosidase n=1 Tax=uncultured Photobacterium sp. TaxID=173973 RepID=UPI0026179263|nr:pseudouridine-5'-phosphate glycosidase [uncultured Photobacterium sp.]
MLEKYLDIHPEVQKALQAGKPVVALESTIITHGMPYPQNLETALKVEQIVRTSGVIPATMAILHGRLKVGLAPEEIEYLAKLGRDVVKTSRRDIPFMIAMQSDGATTVAATMILASIAGIRVFSTGGIGGVHRAAPETFDISADLQELAKTDVAVVCAGVKSVLDIGLTLEYLETQGVPVVGYQTSRLPAFYTRDSGYGVDYQLDSPEEIAQVMKVKWEMGLKGGIVVANPVPEDYSMDKSLMDEVIAEAIIEMEQAGVTGKETTPLLLAKVAEKSAGESLNSNIALVFNNARLAAQIAISYAK